MINYVNLLFIITCHQICYIKIMRMTESISLIKGYELNMFKKIQDKKDKRRKG